MNIFHCFATVLLFFHLNQFCSCRPPPGVVYSVVREYGPDSYSSTTVKRSGPDEDEYEDGDKEQRENQADQFSNLDDDPQLFVTLAYENGLYNYSGYGQRLNSPTSTLLLNNKTKPSSSSSTGSSNWTPVTRKERNESRMKEEIESRRKKDEDEKYSKKKRNKEKRRKDDDDYENDEMKEFKNDLRDRNSWNEFKPGSIESESEGEGFPTTTTDDDNGREWINHGGSYHEDEDGGRGKSEEDGLNEMMMEREGGLMSEEEEELHPQILPPTTGINPEARERSKDNENNYHFPSSNYENYKTFSNSLEGDKTSSLVHRLDDDRDGFLYSSTTPAFPSLPSPPPLVPPPQLEGVIDSTSELINGLMANQSLISSPASSSLTDSLPFTESWTTSSSPPPSSIAATRAALLEEDEDGEDASSLEAARNMGMDQYDKSKLMKPAIKRYHRKEVTTSPIGSYFHESHHVTKELLPTGSHANEDEEAKEESERDTVLGHDDDDDDYTDHSDLTGHSEYPTTGGGGSSLGLEGGVYDTDNDDAYQTAGDGNNNGEGGGVFGYSDTYPYENDDDGDKDDRFLGDDDDKDDDKDSLTGLDDDYQESKSEMYVHEGTDNIPDDMRSPEIVDVPVDAKEAEADQFMKNREAESDHIFGNLEQSQSSVVGTF